MAPDCEHVFCNTCITEWLTSNQTCPLDRTNLTVGALKPAPRILRNFLSRLTLSCYYQIQGCPALLTLESLATHLLDCDFNPKRLVTCQSGCGISITFEELQKHNCLQCLKFDMELLTIVQKENEEKISEMQSELNLQAIVQKQNEEKMLKMQFELDLLKAEIDKLKKGNPAKQSTSSDSQLLPTAGQSQAVNQGTVLTDQSWLTNISIYMNTRDLLFQYCCPTPKKWMLKIARKNISESLCPLEIVNTLIQNSHESRWPPGIRSEEAREANRDQLTAYRYRYLYKTFKNNQLGNGIEVLTSIGIIMAVDNTHMDEDMVARKNISESLCPLEIVNTLIQNSHESRWPPGIRSEEAREANRDQLTAYRYRNLSKSLSIGIIMAVDNTHMDEDMVINPGFLVLIPNFLYLSW
ncbi:E3 ubiquitin-protein ligase NRDP1-like isoform X2 [Artemia franciscana]|uniref:E3 ubiquitin-protein ligase NRDP1-like isoform X2 n=1 Tax=Artemia franciscana TaxID=6661 RepID=UPI0032DA7833